MRLAEYAAQCVAAKWKKRDYLNILADGDEAMILVNGDDLEPVFITVERRLSSLFPAILRRFPLPYVSMAAKNLLVWREKSSPLRHSLVMNTGSYIWPSITPIRNCGICCRSWPRRRACFSGKLDVLICVLSAKMNRPLKTVENQKKGYTKAGKRAIMYALNYAHLQKYDLEETGLRGGRTVKRFWRGALLLGTVLAILLSATGCGSVAKLTFNPQELYSLPKLPAKYTELNNQLNEILEGGAEYAAPTSGTNIQPVQLIDLDGDGKKEALAFFRNSADEKPLKIYIFESKDDTYELAAVVEGSGAAIYSISYSDLDGDGKTELIVGWKVTAALQALSVYALRSTGTEELIRSTNYVKYAVTNLDQDQRQELVVLHAADEEGGGVADYYSWQPGGLTLESTARISMDMAELSGQQGRVLAGTLQDGTPALFVTGVTESVRTITDILTMRDQEFTNIVLSAVTGVSTEISLFRSLYPTDINGDGITEVPCSVPLPTWDDEQGYYQRIDWKAYGSDGTSATVLSTYHDIEDGWYLRLPESWDGRILVSRSSGSEEASVTFYTRGENGELPEPFLRITTITGANRETKAVRGNRFNLARQQETIYVAELLEANQGLEYGVTEDEVRAAFSRITKEWVSGDN